MDIKKMIKVSIATLMAYNGSGAVVIAEQLPLCPKEMRSITSIQRLFPCFYGCLFSLTDGIDH